MPAVGAGVDGCQRGGATAAVTVTSVIWTARRRRPAATCLALLLLVVQLLVSAYACPGQAVMADAATEAALQPCGDHGPQPVDADLPLLCKAHCDPTQSANQLPTGADLDAGAALLPVLLWVLPEPAPLAEVAVPGFDPGHGPPRGAPPLYLSLLVLRN